MIYYYILTSVEANLDLSFHLDTSTLPYQLPLEDKMLLKVFLSAFSVFIALSSCLYFWCVYLTIGNSLFIFCLYGLFTVVIYPFLSQAWVL